MSGILSPIPYLPISGGIITGNLTVDGNIDAATGITVASGAVVAEGTALMQKMAATPVGGFALQNGTPTVISWTASNDGVLHRVMVMASLLVTSAETGGIVNLSGALPSPGGTANDALFNGGASAGSSMSYNPGVVIAPGSTVSVVQATALTAGAAILWAEIWAS